MSYALYDLQTGDYMATGYGSQTLGELKDALLSYISIDYDENSKEWRSLQKLSLEELTEMRELEAEQGEFLAEHFC